jgi:TonB family protein
MMNTLAQFVLESTAALITFMLVYWLWFGRERNFHFNRYYLLATTALSIILPCLQLPLSAQSIVPPTAAIHGAWQLPEIIVGPGTETAKGLSLAHLLLGIYLTGAGFFLLRFIHQGLKLYRFAVEHKTVVSDQKPYKLVNTHGQLPTCSFFHLLFYDDSLPVNEQEKEQILQHEEGHIVQKHSWDIIYFELIKIVFWFNPAINYYRYALAEVHEYMADEYAMNHGNPEDYTRLLARQVLRSFDLRISNHFIKSQTLNRIKMIHSTKKSPLLLKGIVALIFVCVLFYTISCDMANGPIQSSIAKAHIDMLPSVPDAAPAVAAVDTGQDTTIYTVVEDQPEPIGGMKAFYEYVAENVQYPAEAKEKGVEGKVFVEFVVTEDGSLEQVRTLKGIGAGCDAEAERVVRNAEKWKPGREDGKPVKVRMILPITFKMDQKPPAPAKN